MFALLAGKLFGRAFAVLTLSFVLGVYAGLVDDPVEGRVEGICPVEGRTAPPLMEPRFIGLAAPPPGLLRLTGAWRIL